MADITETGGRQADKSPQRELDVLNAVLDTVNALVVVLDHEGRIVRFNRACEQSTGYRFAEVEGRPFWDFLLVPEEVERVKGAFAHLQTSQFPNAYENFWVARDGRRRLIAWSNTALPGEDGAVEYVIGTGLDVTETAPLFTHGEMSGEVAALHDITAQAQAEQALRESEEKLARLFEILPIGVSVLDRDRNVVKANPALARILAYSADALQQGRFRERRYLTAEETPFPPQDFPSVRAFEEQSPIHAVEIGIVKEDGEMIWTSVSAAPVQFPDWKVVIATVDITDRKRAEQALRHALDESRQRQAEVSALLDGARQVLAQHDFEHTARSIFDTCKGLIGATAGYVALSSKDGMANEVLFLDPGDSSCMADTTLPMPIRGLRAQVYRSGSVALEDDFRSSLWSESLPEGHLGVDNLLFAPLVIGGQVVGLLGLANKPGGFTENDKRLATAFAELAAIALHNSQLMASLEASELRFRSVVETANAAIVTTDNEGRITFWNRMAETIFG